MDTKEGREFSVEAGNENEDFDESDIETQEENQDKPQTEKPKGNIVENLYDKIPLNYKQVDIFVKIMLAVLVILLIIGIATGPMFK